ncbi:hypothetical protein [Serratia liquefaciens]|uniref:Uncharacterized protein n=1 Tax=Serratia liquefaciens TaxID=614 RepID=A0A515CRV8_SERLI|nr:hypothetical protein [Serratia liquefaciens]QDL30863.1 hypothetical protein EGO53_03250 [Serratia liquefaciens]
MNQPFYAAANKVLAMYVRRQELARGEKAPPHSYSEIEWACDLLLDLARAAAYTVSRESIVIKAAAEFWKKTQQMPEFFSAETEDKFEWR